LLFIIPLALVLAITGAFAAAVLLKQLTGWWETGWWQSSPLSATLESSGIPLPRSDWLMIQRVFDYFASLETAVVILPAVFAVWRGTVAASDCLNAAWIHGLRNIRQQRSMGRPPRPSKERYAPNGRSRVPYLFAFTFLFGRRGVVRDAHLQVQRKANRLSGTSDHALISVFILGFVVMGSFGLSVGSTLVIPAAIICSILIAVLLVKDLWRSTEVKAETERQRQANQEMEAAKQREALRQSRADAKASRDPARKQAEEERRARRCYEEQREAQRQQEAEQQRRAEQEREAERDRRQAEQEHEAERQRRRAEQERESDGRRRQERDQSSERHSEPPEWWEVLEVLPDAGRDEIARSYRRKIQQCHPDRVAGLAPEFIALAEDRTKALNAAYRQAMRACNEGR
jgi:hypothetical protein